MEVTSATGRLAGSRCECTRESDEEVQWCGVELVREAGARVQWRARGRGAEGEWARTDGEVGDAVHEGLGVEGLEDARVGCPHLVGAELRARVHAREHHAHVGRRHPLLLQRALLRLVLWYYIRVRVRAGVRVRRLGREGRFTRRRTADKRGGHARLARLGRLVIVRVRTKRLERVQHCGHVARRARRGARAARRECVERAPRAPEVRALLHQHQVCQHRAELEADVVHLRHGGYQYEYVRVVALVTSTST